jgi:hypothetical protein
MSRRLFIAVIVALCVIVLIQSCSAVYTPRNKTSTTMTTIPTEPYNAIVNAFGDPNPANESEAGINITQMLGASAGTASVYTYLLGNLAMVIILAIPFVLMWLMQSDIIIPATAGIFCGGFFIYWLPSEYWIVPVIFIALGITAVIYSLLTKRS